MPPAEQTPEATVDWMSSDIATRCRSVLELLASDTTSAAHLGQAAALLRGAADDLASLVELVEGPTAANGESADEVPAFGLSFQDAVRSGRHD